MRRSEAGEVPAQSPRPAQVARWQDFSLMCRIVRRHPAYSSGPVHWGGGCLRPRHSCSSHSPADCWQVSPRLAPSLVSPEPSHAVTPPETARASKSQNMALIFPLSPRAEPVDRGVTASRVRAHPSTVYANLWPDRLSGQRPNAFRSRKCSPDVGLLDAPCGRGNITALV